VTALVIGANGYLGSHVTRQLVEAGQDVRVMVLEGSNTRGIDGLAVSRFTGVILNSEVLLEAMIV
jgi:dihydroflavonol-4-reductase